MTLLSTFLFFVLGVALIAKASSSRALRLERVVHRSYKRS
jgi:hypothetical protein